MWRPDAAAAPAAERFTGRLDAVLRRVRAADVLGAIMAAAAVAALVTIATTVAGPSSRVALALAFAVATALLILGRRMRFWTRAAAARRLELACPESRNAIVTAEELLRHPDGVRPAIVRRVVEVAAGPASALPAADVVPLRRDALLCALALIAWAAVAAGIPSRAAPVLREAASRAGLVSPTASREPLRITASLTPPAYLAGDAQRLVDPERIEAVAGTKLSLEMSGNDSAIRVRLGSTPLSTSRSPEGLVAQVTLGATTYIAVEAANREDPRRLIPVVVTPDRAPSIRIEQPARDLLLPDTGATIPVTAAATDDFGLSSLELRYTKVSGSGEQFDFEEGTLPLRITRNTGKSWSGRTVLALPRMNLEPGDALVYRVVGADRRPGGAGAASSDTYFVEIAGPDQVTLAGFELPPDRERYALSQQMILLKIQRLRAREKSMPHEAVKEEAGAIAVEQRSVRANFIFLTGGHVEDETEDAEHSHEVQEGRLEHSARREIEDAIEHMSHTEQALVAIDTATALSAARAAVEALQRAFGRSRYLLRSLPVRSRLDPSRRLSGELDDASDWRRTVEEPEARPGAVVARELLIQLMDLASAMTTDRAAADATRLSRMAERALTVDAASQNWHQISGALEQLRDSIAAGRERSEIDKRLNAVIRDLRAESQRAAIPAVPADQRNRGLRGAWGAIAGQGR